MVGDGLGGIPWLGVRKYARALAAERDQLARDLAIEKTKTEKLGDVAQNLLKDAKEIQRENIRLKSLMEELHLLSLAELEGRRDELDQEVDRLQKQAQTERASIEADRADLRRQIDEVRQTIVETREAALLQEVGIYEYNHPLKDVVAYERALKQLEASIKAAIKSDGGAIQSDTAWEVNGSKVEGAKMTKEISKLMLRAFNAEAESIVRSLKPYKQDAAIQRLRKVEETIRKLGKTMQIAVSPTYVQLRIDEIKLTSDYLQRQAEEKEAERQEREKMREERKAQQEIERERVKLDKEKQHYENVLQALVKMEMRTARLGCVIN